MYYCAAHQVAYPEARQFQGHFLHAHPGEERPPSDTVFVEQVPEGTEIAGPPKGRRTPRKPAPADPAGTGSTTPPAATPPRPVDEPVARVRVPAFDDDDEGARLDRLLIGIGVPLLNRQAIVTGYRSFGQISENPYNLTNFINTHIPPKLRGLLPLVIQEMFPGTEQAPQDAPFFYPPQGQFRPPPQFYPGQRPVYQTRWADDSFAYDPRYTRPAPQGYAGPEEVNPEIAALKKQNADILEELKANREERAQERAEQREKERDAAFQGQINALGGKLDGVFTEVSTMVKGLTDQIQRGHTEGEASHTQQLADKVTTLTEKIADQREVQLQSTVDALRGELGEVRQKLNAEPTGKTTEDLLSQAIPLALSEARNIGATVTTELQGIRQQAADGKLPNLSVPNAGKTGDLADPMKTAQQIAGARAVEDKVLALAGRQPRS